MRATLDRPKPSISVIYGRRRVGKSALISKALENRSALYFEGLENQRTSEQISNFCLQLTKQTGAKAVETQPETWRQAFLLLEPVLKQKPACIVFDEFQWMANYRSAIVSDLKMVWDQYLSHISGVSLVMCGSIASYMLKNVVKGSALYGRTDRVIHLREFSLLETAKMLPGYGKDELLDAYMILGGIPKYQELLGDYPSLYLAIEELGFRENGFLVDEFDRIFVSHFGKNKDYTRIIGTLAKHPYGMFRKTLAKSASVDTGGGLTRNLNDLESAGFIHAIKPIFKQDNTKLIKYVLTDAYLRFYYSLMRPELVRIKSGRSTLRFAALVQKPVFHSWRGRAFELTCMQHAPLIAKTLGFHGIEYDFGPFFKAARTKTVGMQADLVFNRADNVLTLCEMKYSQSPIGTGIIKDINKKADFLKKYFPSKTIQKVLIYHGSVTSGVSQSPYIYQAINSDFLLSDKQILSSI